MLKLPSFAGLQCKFFCTKANFWASPPPPPYCFEVPGSKPITNSFPPSISIPSMALYPLFHHTPFFTQPICPYSFIPSLIILCSYLSSLLHLIFPYSFTPSLIILSSHPSLLFYPILNHSVILSFLTLNPLPISKWFLSSPCHYYCIPFSSFHHPLIFHPVFPHSFIPSFLTHSSYLSNYFIPSRCSVH